MSRKFLWGKCALVLILVMPLIVFEGRDAPLPSWLSQRWGGVPVTALASVALFISLVVLTALFSASSADPTAASAGSRRPP